MEEHVKKDMSEVTELDLMREFMDLTNQPLLETELTVSKFMEYTGVEKNRARYLLSKYQQQGLLKVRKISMNRTNINAYSPAEGTTWKDVVDAMKHKE